jgi:hypothetical protein
MIREEPGNWEPIFHCLCMFAGAVGRAPEILQEWSKHLNPKSSELNIYYSGLPSPACPEPQLAAMR